MSKHDLANNRRDNYWHSTWFVPLLAGVLAAVLFAITLQTHINGSADYYATDVGEMQNALPRWGTLHFTGYPLYAITGSLIVTLLRLVGVAPAAGSSIVSLLWGALTIGLVARLILELGARPSSALIGSLTMAVATSMWIDSSIAEVHTMTMMFTAAMVWFAVRYGRDGKRSDLLWLAVVSGQGLTHMRAVLFVAPAILVLIAPQWRDIIKWRNLLPMLGIGLAAPLLYIYMPLREWMGADWTFGQTSTWQGFWTMVLDTKAERIINPASSLADWLERARIILSLLGDDLPLLLQGIGALGLFAFVRPRDKNSWREAIGLQLVWLPYVLLGLIIWEGRVSDALLAVKLPAPMMAGVGLALLIDRLLSWRPPAGYATYGLCTLALIFSGWRNYPAVTAITRDRSVEDRIAIADQASNPDQPTVMMALWGHTYWGLTYAQAYRGQLEGLILVDHNATFDQILDEDYVLITLPETFYVLPPSDWESWLGAFHLNSYAPGLVEIGDQPNLSNDSPESVLENGVALVDHAVEETSPGVYQLTLWWRAERAIDRDYSVFVHLTQVEVPASGEDILAQADSSAPVYGWYPTTRWTVGEAVREDYILQSPADYEGPLFIRAGMYHQLEDGSFENFEALTIPVRR